MGFLAIIDVVVAVVVVVALVPVVRSSGRGFRDSPCEHALTRARSRRSRRGWLRWRRGRRVSRFVSVNSRREGRKREKAHVRARPFRPSRGSGDVEIFSTWRQVKRFFSRCRSV